MLSKAFKIIEPKRFDMYIEDVNITQDEVLVKVDYLSVCKADLRYYKGARDEKILSLKYPMSLIHEATGIVIKDPTKQFQMGDRVVLIPNVIQRKCDINCVCEDQQLGENYCPHASFASSNIDGFSKEYVKLCSNQLLKISEDIPSEVAVFSEMISVACAAVRRLTSLEGNIGIWGDGILGYILAATIKTLYPNTTVIIFGKHSEKLENFVSDQKYLIDDSVDLNLDIAFECVGGKASSTAINQAIQMLKIGGSLVLTGVTEDLAPINTRKILEKGLNLTGTTRSQKADFEKAISLLKDNKFLQVIKKLILTEKEITNIYEYYEVFEKEAINKELGKHLMKLNL